VNWPLFLVDETDSVSDAIDELADNDKSAHHIVVPDEDLSDYPEADRHYGPSGQVLDLDHLMIHGQEGIECPPTDTPLAGALAGEQQPDWFSTLA
jgi:hypothetical protein